MRITRTYRQSINATPERVFPLLCPVREAQWLDGWRYAMIYSESGVIEQGAVFSTAQEGEADTVWIVSRHDAQQRQIEFVRFTPGSRTCVLKIAVDASGVDRSTIDISYTYTATTPAGVEFIERFTEEAFVRAMVHWEKSRNHFLETAEKLASEP